MNTQTKEAAEKCNHEWEEFKYTALGVEEFMTTKRCNICGMVDFENLWQQSQLPEKEQEVKAVGLTLQQAQEIRKRVKHYNDDILAFNDWFNKTYPQLIVEGKAVVNTPIQDISEAIGKIDAALKSREGKAVGDAEIEGWDMKHKPKIAEQIAAYVHEIDSLQETNRKLGDKIAEFQKQNDDYIAIIMEQERAKDLLVNRIEGMRKDTDMWVRREKLLEAEIAALQKKITEIQNDFMQVQTNEQIARFDKEDKLNMGRVNP